MIKIHRAVLSILNFENVSPEEVKSLLEQNRYLSPVVLSLETKDVCEHGGWEDDNKFNQRMNLAQFNEAFDAL